jgi:hypothetical protein
VAGGRWLWRRRRGVSLGALISGCIVFSSALGLSPGARCRALGHSSARRGAGNERPAVDGPGRGARASVIRDVVCKASISPRWDSPSSSTPSGGPSPSAARSSAQNAEQPSRQIEPAQSPFRQAPPPLTGRELDVLRLLAAGRSNQRIAHDLVARRGSLALVMPTARLADKTFHAPQRTDRHGWVNMRHHRTETSSIG